MKPFNVYTIGLFLTIIYGVCGAQTSKYNFMNNSDKSDINFTPEWAKNVVWYQIFPERFRNGDKSNDPVIESIKGAWPHDTTSEWQIHPWTSDWYELQPYEKDNGKDIWHNIQRRRYGGDIQGIIDKLNYLEELGITALYLNPVFEAPSLHKYDAATFHHIDPHFGPDPEGDKDKIQSEIPDDPSSWVWTEADKLFLTLIKEVHKRNMKIIIDGVFNHMGLNSWAFRDVEAKQQNSKYKDWFSVKSWDDPDNNKNFDYEGWFGVKELPEFSENEYGIVDGPKQYIFNITKRWMDPNNDGDPSDGIDGWRLDVAYCVKHNFWKAWRKHVKSINPESYITAEVIESVDDLIPYLEGDEFDAVMNYNYLFTCSEYFFDDETAVTTSEFDDQLRRLREAFPESVTYVQQNLHGSHDTQRMASHIVNRDKYKIRNWGETFEKWKGSNPAYDVGKPDKSELQKIKLMLVFQFTYVGAPYIYYGDEAGMWGANDPCSRKPMVWDHLVYSDEKYLPDQTLKTEADKVSFNQDMFEHYKQLIKIRNENPALQRGNFKSVLKDDENRIYAFIRSYDQDEILIVLNNSRHSKKVNIKSGLKGSFKNLLSTNKIIESINGIIELNTEPDTGYIFLKMK